MNLDPQGAGNINFVGQGPATSGTNFSSPAININGNYWNGTASNSDLWSIQDVLGTGANPSTTLTIGRTGSTGASNVAIQSNLIIGVTHLGGTVAPANDSRWSIYTAADSASTTNSALYIAPTDTSVKRLFFGIPTRTLYSIDFTQVANGLTGVLQISGAAGQLLSFAAGGDAVYSTGFFGFRSTGTTSTPAVICNDRTTDSATSVGIVLKVKNTFSTLGSRVLSIDNGATQLVTVLPSGNVGIGTIAPKAPLHVVGLVVYANNAAAITGGLTAGAFYRTGADPDVVCVVH
jgi:hypothetical protein